MTDEIPGDNAQMAHARAAFQEWHQRHVAPDVEHGIATLTAWVDGQSDLASSTDHTPTHGPRVRSRTVPPAMLATALGLSAFALLAAVGVLSRRSQTSPLTQRYYTALGQRSTIRLADGSTMILAPATTVTQTADGINVTGEAYFTIRSHPTQPFVVRTNNAVVQVLGTRFTVRQYPGDATSRVVVEDGRVALRAESPSRSRSAPTVISSRAMALVTDSGVTVTSGIATRDYTSWTQGTLVFNRAPLRDVVVELGRAYDADIRIADSVLAGKTIVAEVEVNKRPLIQILAAISLSMDAHYVQHGRSFVLARGRSEDQNPDRPGEQLSHPQLQNRFPQPEQQYGR